MEITIIDTVKMQDFLRRTFEPLTKEKETIISCLCFSTNLLPAVQKAYVQSWKKRIKDWGKEFIYIVSQADKAFNYICGDVDAINGVGEEE